MSFGASVRNGLGVGLISYATLLARRGGGGSSGLWILTTGFWDDTGIWVDSANWID
jgi:hypothetical protein